MDWDLGRIIAMNLKQLRTERSLTLGQLAKESGVSKAILSDMEKGESNPTINTIIIHHIPRTHRTIQNLQGTLLPIARVNTKTHHRHITITQRQLR